jgi:hypothetical protein
MVVTSMPHYLFPSVNCHLRRIALRADVPLLIALAAIQSLAPCSIPLEDNRPRLYQLSYLPNANIAIRTTCGVARSTSKTGAPCHCRFLDGCIYVMGWRK